MPHNHVPSDKTIVRLVNNLYGRYKIKKATKKASKEENAASKKVLTYAVTMLMTAGALPKFTEGELRNIARKIG